MRVTVRGYPLSGLTPSGCLAVRRRGVSALMWAASYDYHAIVEKLIGARADVNNRQSGYGCAFRSARCRRRPMVRRFRRAAPSGRKTALHWAAEYGCTKSAVALLVGGADQTITNDDG